MTTNDIDAIRTQYEAHRGELPTYDGGTAVYCCGGCLVAEAVPALCDELEQTRAELMLTTSLLGSAHGERTVLRGRLHDATAALTESRKGAADIANEIGAIKAELERMRAGSTDGPWKALIVRESWVEDNFSDLAAEDEVDIVIVRGSALPDDEGHMPGTYKSDDVAFEAEDIYVDGDGGIDAPTVYARAQVMAAGLNASEAAR